MKQRTRTRMIFTGLLIIVALNCNLFALDTSNLTPEAKIAAIHEWAPSANLIIQKSALVSSHLPAFKKYYNLIARQDFYVTGAIKSSIEYDGGKFMKFARRCRIVEHDKDNPYLVRLEYIIEYSNDIMDIYWTHVRWLMTLEEYKERFV